jgi:thiopeptide-type bacteriocin biosynthesis protein
MMGDGTDGKWVSLHVFYSGDADPMMVEAVRPLVARLREDGLIEAWFFIKYWKGGPHLRLRFKPVSAEVREEVTTRAVDAIQKCLTRRPALFDIYTDAESRGTIYKKIYVAEYGGGGTRSTA